MKSACLLSLFSSLFLLASATDFHSPPPQPTPFNSQDFCSQNITEICNTTFNYIDEVNQQVRPSIEELVTTNYFKYFKLNLYKTCPFWDESHFCMSRDCAVDIIEDWDSVNDSLKPEHLGSLSLKYSSADLEKQCDKDFEYTEIDDDNSCVYVNLAENPERFTGYGGPQSHQIWTSIYNENCFPNTHTSPKTGNEEEDVCIEKKLFYRLMSGMHASIAVHLSNEYLNVNTGEYKPNLKLFMERVGYHNDRISNIYFNYALVIQAIAKLNEFIPLKSIVNEQSQHTFETDDSIKVATLLDDLLPVINETSIFDSSKFFQDQPDLKSEFRERFKNVTSIMDCVGCDRCRMWGKIQTIGYGTALKILFELEEDNLPHIDLKNLEIIALMNTFDRLSKSIESINNFKQLYEEAIAKGNFELNDEDSNNLGLAFPFKESVQTKKTSSNIVASGQESPVTANKKRRLPQSTGSSTTKPKTENKKEKSFKHEVRLALDDISNALGFMYRAYLDFPRIVFNVIIGKLNEYWNIFVGLEWKNYGQNPYEDLFKLEL